MIEKISRGGTEVCQVGHPVEQWNGDSVFILFVTLAFQGQERHSLIGCNLQQRTGHGIQRWRLVVARISSAQYPVDARQFDRNTKSRISCIFGNDSREMRVAQPSGKRKPRGRFELVFREERGEAAGRIYTLRDGVAR